MPRAIKFRAWDVDTKIMFAPFNLLDFIVSNELTQNKLCPVSIYDDEQSLMQFTGLHDKNGKEIYEGDIVRATDGAGLCEVKFDSGCFWRVWLERDAKGFLMNSLDEFEVIGNIYENKELLDSK